MAFFGVTIETISDVWPHPNADRLDLAKVDGMAFQFVVGRDNYQRGDRVLYFPVDSLLPVAVTDALGLTGKLAGKDKNRVRTIRLRGEVSQGLVAKPETVLGDRAVDFGHITKHLGVTKYEPPIVETTSAKLAPLPDGVEVYDIEGADRYTDAVEMLMDQPVYITEKLEGTNFAAVREPDGKIYYCTRRRRIEEVDGVANVYCETARREDVPGLLNCIVDAADAATGGEFPPRVVLRGELIGPKFKRNIYRLQEHTIQFFDLKLDASYMPPEFFMEMVGEAHRVPTLSVGGTLRDWLAGRSVQEASNGRSVLADTRREGIVIKPMTEQHAKFGGRERRLFIKQRSPEYLAKEK